MNVETDILTALRRIMRATELHSRDLSRRHGLTGPQLIVLNRLKDRPDGVSVGQLAREINLSQPTVTGIITRLERRSLLARIRSRTDRRCVLVHLTAAGAQVLAEAPPVLQEQFLARLRACAEWERTQILAILQRVVSMMEADRIDVLPLLLDGEFVDEPTHPDRARRGASSQS